MLSLLNEIRIWKQSAVPFSTKPVSLCLCNLTLCCFCHLHLVNAGQVFSSAGFSISRMSEGHTQDSGILGSCEGLAASLELHEKQHGVKIYSSRCFKVQMLQHVFG